MDAKFFHVCGIPLIPWDETRRKFDPMKWKFQTAGRLLALLALSGALLAAPCPRRPRPVC